MSSSTLYTGIAVVLAIAVVVLFFFFPNYLRGIGSSSDQTQTQDAVNPPTDNSSDTGASASTPAPAPTTLVSQDAKVGTGATAKAGDTIIVEYTGKLADGTVFDASSAHGTQVMPGCSKSGQFCFTLGSGQVIPGWDQGLVGMKVGGERTLVIPPNLAYGPQGNGPIPPNATLTFDIKLVDLKPGTGSEMYAPTGAAAE